MSQYNDKLNAILSRNPRIKAAILFGSRATGTATPESDIDIALIGDELTLDDVSGLLREFETTTIPQRVDVLILDQIDNAVLRDHIHEHGVPIYERTSAGHSSGV